VWCGVVVQQCNLQGSNLANAALPCSDGKVLLEVRTPVSRECSFNVGSQVFAAFLLCSKMLTLLYCHIVMSCTDERHPEVAVLLCTVHNGITSMASGCCS
jgi:hypothetical protein